MVWQPNTEQERTADNAGYGIWWRKRRAKTSSCAG